MIKKAKESLKKFTHTLYTVNYMVKRMWKEREGKLYILITFILMPFNAIIPIIYTVFPGMIINELTGQRRISVMAVYVGILILSPVLHQFISLYANVKSDKLYRSLDTIFTAEFFEHIALMDYDLLEDPDMQMKSERAYDMVGAYTAIITQIQNFITSVIGLVTYSAIIITVSPLVIVLILIIVYINSITARIKNDKVRKINIEEQKYLRFTEGARRYFTDIDYAKEIRSFNLTSYFINLFKKKCDDANNVGIEATKVSERTDLINVSLSSFQQAVLYVYLIYNVLVEKSGIGDMTICMSAVNQFAGSLKTVMEKYMFFEGMSVQIQDLIDFYSIPAKHRKGNIIPHFDEHSKIEFKNVSFKYPGSDSYALKNISLTLDSSEKLCIVGANGSGKSTFIKLLTRLYLPTEGEILLNGININEYDYDIYQKLFAPVYQDFCLYRLSVGENIVLNNELDNDKLDNIGISCGLSEMIEKLPQRYDTPVTRQDSNIGISPSGGEAQKIAMARSVYKDGSIFLFDEPTAALDPLSEYEIYKRFNTIITNKCAILITHRLSAVQLSDKVAVFDNGNLIEYGTHTELYRNGGVYKEMFDKQAQFYINESQDNANEVVNNSIVENS